MNKLVEILGKLTDIMIISVLWIVFSLPVVTLGASTAATYHVVTKVFLGDSSYIVREFWRAFKLNFKQSTIVWMIAIPIILIFSTNFWLMLEIIPEFIPENFYKVVLVVLVYFAAMAIMYCNCMFASIVRFKTTLKQLFKNSFILIMAHLPWHLLVFFVFVISVIVIWSIPITVLFIPTVYMICASKIYEHIFRKYIK